MATVLLPSACAPAPTATDGLIEPPKKVPDAKLLKPIAMD
jgi:hypothetical protein